MSTLKIFAVAVVVAGLALAPAADSLASYNKEHAGKHEGGSKGHDMMAHKAQTLKEAAAALRAGEARPDLADKLEKMSAHFAKKAEHKHHEGSH